MSEKMDKEKVEGILSDVSPENCFWAANGVVIKNLQELEPAIEKMDEEAFRIHVNEEKNDFGSWVKDVIGDVEFADQLSKTKDKTMTQLLIVKRILQLRQ